MHELPIKPYDPDQEIVRWQEVLRRDPNDPCAHAGLGEAWYQKAFRSRLRAEWLQARAFLEVAVAAFPDNSHYWMELSQALYWLGARADALEAAQRAVAMNRLDTRCYGNLARMQRRMGRWRSLWQTWRAWFRIEYRRGIYDNGENDPPHP